MFDFSSLNTGRRTVMEGIDTTNMDYVPLKSYVGKKIPVKGFFFTEGKYGKQVVLVSDNLINMPKRSTEQFEAIASNPEALGAMLAGHLELTNIKPVETRNGSTTGYDLATV